MMLLLLAKITEFNNFAIFYSGFLATFFYKVDIADSKINVANRGEYNFEENIIQIKS